MLIAFQGEVFEGQESPFLRLALELGFFKGILSSHALVSYL